MTHQEGPTAETKKSSDGRFVFQVELPTLQSMASNRIALSILYNYLRRWMRNRDPFDKLLKYLTLIKYDFGRVRGYEAGVYWCGNDIYKLIDSLKTPPRIDAMLRESLKKVRDEMDKWREQLFISTFIPEWCVWLPNGEIDYRKSAINILNSGELDEIGEFEFKYKYCMEDEIGKTVMTDLIEENFFEDVNFDYQPNLFYWICFMKNKLHEIPLGNFTSIAGAVAGSVKSDTKEPLAMEYFWHRMTPDDQRSTFESWINYGFNFAPEKSRIIPTIIRLFSTMHWSQQIILLSTIPEKIIKFGIYENSPRISFWAWNHCKDTFTVEQFQRMFINLLQNAKYDDEKMYLIIEIWDTAPEYLKNHRNLVDNLKLDSSWRDKYLCLTFFEFFYNMCRRKDSFECSCGSYYFALSLVRNIFNLCSLINLFEATQPDLAERLNFRKTIERERFKNYCISLLNEGNFDDLQSMVEWFAEGNMLMTQAFYNILLSDPKFRENSLNIHMIYDFDKWKKLCKLYDFVYPENSSLVYERKLNFVSWVASYCKFQLKFRNNVDKMIVILNKAFAKEDLDLIKKLFLDSFRERFKIPSYWQFEYECDGKFIEKFVTWCLNDDRDEIYEFKTNLAATIIYDRILDGFLRDTLSVRAAFVEILLDRLDKYLMWCLETEENVRAFKIRKMSRSDRDLDPFRRLSREPDERTMKILLKWCFDGDKVAIKRFRSRRIKKLKKIPNKSVHYPYSYGWFTY